MFHKVLFMLGRINSQIVMQPQIRSEFIPFEFLMTPSVALWNERLIVNHEVRCERL